MTILGELVVLPIALGVTLVVSGVMTYFAWRAFRRAGVRLSTFLPPPAALDIKLDPGGDWSPPPESLHLQPFRDGTYREAHNVLRGSVNGLPVRVFDYQHVLEHGRNAETCRYRVALFQLPVDAPPLSVRPEHLWEAASRLLNAREISFESEEFNRRYHVQCEDRRFAFDVLHPRAMQTLLDSKKGLALEMGGAFLVLYDGPLPEGAPVDLDADLELLAVGRDIVWSLPAYVRDDRPPEHPVTW